MSVVAEIGAIIQSRRVYSGCCQAINGFGKYMITEKYGVMELFINKLFISCRNGSGYHTPHWKK